MARHTPGMWTILQEDDADGRPHYVLDYEDVRCMPPGEHDANARLISLAPDMLEIIEDVNDWLGKNALDWDWNNEPPWYRRFHEIMTLANGERKAVA